MTHERQPRAHSGSWEATLYDTKLSFNTDFGQDLVELLAPRPGETILDLGCGTGDLAHRIATSGATVVGIDRSPTMLDRARQKYPSLAFVQADGQNFAFPPGTFDAVFSNAALHWMKDAAGVVACVWSVLKPGGRFVAEFGGKGNIQAVVEAITAALGTAGYPVVGRNPWYYPTIGEYATLLERQGFRVIRALHFDRPTRLDDGERGLANWLTMFAGAFFDDVSDADRVMLYADIARRLRPLLFHDGAWVIDYVRLRVEAVKER